MSSIAVRNVDETKTMNALIWFRNDLRVHDNLSLRSVEDADSVLAVYCFDPKQFQKGDYGFKKTEKFRAKFLIESIYNLKENLAKLNITLLVFFDEPEQVIPDLIDTHKIGAVHLQAEWTRDEIDVLQRIKSKVTENIEFIEHLGQFLYHPEDVPFPTYQEIPKSFTNFRKKVEQLTEVRALTAHTKPRESKNCIATETTIPTLEQLGFEDFESDPRAAFEFKGGEDHALKRMESYFWTTQNITTYKKTRNGLLGADYSSKFSPWLANGSLSPKLIYWELKKFEQNVCKNESTYWMVFELLWRDFFKYVSLKHGSEFFKIGGILNKSYNWNSDGDSVQKWIQGKTKEPFVNANMIELAKTGWMSNRGRQNVASYLSREMKVDWRIGASYFESVLLDYDVHSNWGNWMYVSGVGNDPRDRKFNSKRQAENYDPESKFQNHWLS